MSFTAIILVAYFLLGGLYWLAMIRSMFLIVARTPVMAASDLPVPTDWPRLSVVVPACNEEADIEAAATSLLRQDYGDLEVVLVDDRSSDRTPEIIDRLASGGPDVKAVHVTHLPEGWLGKVHALDEGLQQRFAAGAHIVPDHQAIAGGLPALVPAHETAEKRRRRVPDAPGEVLVDLIGIHAADIVCLESLVELRHDRSRLSAEGGIIGQMLPESNKGLAR